MHATALQLDYPGTPMIYYGDDTGHEGDYAEEGRRPIPWKDVGAQWSEAQSRAPLLDFFRQAINMRRNSRALSHGQVQTMWIDDKGGYGFVRQSGEEVVLALFNSSSKPLDASIHMGAGYSDGEWTDLLGNTSANLKEGTLSATIPPLGAAWLAPQDTRRRDEFRTLMQFPKLADTST